MNTYFVPVSYMLDNHYDYIYMVHADNPKDAFYETCHMLYDSFYPSGSLKYECCKGKLKIPSGFKNPFYKTELRKILKNIFLTEMQIH